MTPTTPPASPPPPPPRRLSPPRPTRATIVLVAVGMLLVAALAVGIVSVGTWGWTALRMQARTSPYDTATAAPPVVGPPGPESAGSTRTTPPPEPPGTPALPAGPPPGAPAPPSPERATDVAPLHMPVDGVAPTDLYPSFDEARGARRHEAIDIMAPRGTPVRAAVDGEVVKLFTSDAGGLTVYQFDRDERLAYYYAHLDRYADGLREGRTLSRGDVLGYVGSTGNASADAPHLHFAIFELGPEKRWWEGRPIDPYPLLGGT